MERATARNLAIVSVAVEIMLVIVVVADLFVRYPSQPLFGFESTPISFFGSIFMGLIIGWLVVNYHYGPQATGNEPLMKMVTIVAAAVVLLVGLFFIWSGLQNPTLPTYCPPTGISCGEGAPVGTLFLLFGVPLLGYGLFLSGLSALSVLRKVS